MLDKKLIVAEMNNYKATASKPNVVIEWILKKINDGCYDIKESHDELLNEVVRKSNHESEAEKFNDIAMMALYWDTPIFFLEKGIKLATELFNSRDWEEYTTLVTLLYQNTLRTLKGTVADKKEQEESSTKLNEEEFMRDRDKMIEVQKIENEKRAALASEVAQRESEREIKKSTE